MSIEYNVDPENTAQIKEILEKQLLIKKNLSSLMSRWKGLLLSSMMICI